ncbi:MAG: efflux RND transporter permease subunit, partial [Propionibacteriaceae bacterium]|nr:efflux RND transporter permease subunit [Propionibacteriaceae bacterium]
MAPRPVPPPLEVTMFRLAQLSLRNRAVVALVSLGLLVGGALSMTSLKQELIPSLDVPMALVTATNPGVTNELMEQQLATPLETAIESVPGVDSVQVTSVNSAVFAIAEFEYGTDMDLANQKLTTAISKIAARLPSGVETNVLTGSMDDMPILQFAVNGADGAATADVGHLVNDVLVPRLSRLANVRSVDVTGYAAERVTVTPRPADLARFGVTLSQFNDLLSDYGLSLPAGTVADGGLTLSVQAGNALASADDLAGLPLAQSPDGGVVRVEDVADVTQAPAAATSYSRLDGANAVSVSITKTPAGNTVEVSETVRDTLEEMAGVLADAGLEATVVFDQAPMIERSIDGLSEEGLLGLGFAVVVILLFLFSVRSTLVSAVSIPLSLLAAFVALKGTGETLNILTLGGLTIAIGRVVDDAIVVIENIKRHLSYGEAKHDAIVGAVKEVGGAVASSTICT